MVEETFLASLFRGEFFNLAFNLPGAAYSQRDDIGLIPWSFNSETPRQRDTFKHIEAGSCSRSSFALSSPFHIYLGLLHYAATRTSPFLFFFSPFLSVGISGIIGLFGNERRRRYSERTRRLLLRAEGIYERQ